MKMKIHKLRDNATIPTRGSKCAAGYDLYAALENGDAACSVRAGETVMIGTGLSIEIPDGYFGAIYARSGLACKQGLRPANCVGVIDSDYRGEVKVALHNDGDIIRSVYDKTRIAQLIIQKYEEVEFEVVDSLSDTDRGDGGFGSTGTN